MNSLIEILNKWGGRFLDFAVPMFWQAGLLIVALLAFDFLFRHKVRASVRYALWLVVLVKLILPPALALPTSPAWWLHSNQLAISAKPVIKNYTVSYDSSPLPDNSLKTFTAFVPPKPVMTWAAWLLVLSAVVSAGLFVWLLVRWWQITRQVSRAKNSERLTAIIAPARLLAGVRGEPPVKLTANTMSPAVCGLFRPAILIPESLAEHFSEEQMRAVLLHELIHLRRRDVWLNFCQSLLQIVYWWHPLVWVANARIRRVREEAVDDAVMLALAGEAETYAPTLLEVAKLALNRPLASLGLVGILESRSALRERIERLVDFRAPRPAGLTLVSIFGVLAFSAVAVPMGGAPASTEEKTPEISEVLSSVATAPKTNAPVILVTSYFYRLSAGDFETAVSNLKFKEGETTNDPYWVASPDDFSQLIKNLKSSGQQLYLSPRIVTASGIEAATYIGDGTNRGSGLDVRPVIEGGLVDMRIIGDVVLKTGDFPETNQFATAALMPDASGIVVRPGGKVSDLLVAISIQIETNGYHERLERIVKKTQPSAEDIAKAANMVQDAKFYYEMGKLADAEASAKSALVLNPDNAAATYYLKLIAESRQKQHEAMAGMPPPKRPKSLDKLDQIQIDQFGPFVNTPLGQVMRELSEAAKRSDPEKQGITFLIGSPLGDPAKPPLDVNSVFVNLPSVLKHVKMGEVLDAIKKDSSGPINFWFLDTTIAYWVEDRQALHERSFKLRPETFKFNLRKKMTLTVATSDVDIAEACRTLSSEAGVDWSSPKGKAIFYNDHLGMLFVKATEPDLDVIEHIILELNEPLAQIHVKARFIEVPKGTLAGIGKIMVPTNQLDQGTGVVGILTSENFKTTLQSLERLPGAEELAEPEVTTITGRQVQMKSTELITVVTNITFPPPMTNLPVVSTPSPPPAGGYRVDGSAITPQSIQIETGPIFDFVSYVLADGYTINLTADASLTQFLGYRATNNTPVTYPQPAGSPGNLLIHPEFQVLKSNARINLWDNQTLVMEIKVPPTSSFSNVPVLGDIPLVSNLFQNQKPGNQQPEKELLVFVTATIVDPAGNRVHEDELAFTSAIPPQPSLSPTSAK